MQIPAEKTTPFTLPHELVSATQVPVVGSTGNADTSRAVVLAMHSYLNGNAWRRASATMRIDSQSSAVSHAHAQSCVNSKRLTPPAVRMGPASAMTLPTTTVPNSCRVYDVSTMARIVASGTRHGVGAMVGAKLGAAVGRWVGTDEGALVVGSVLGAGLGPIVG